MAAPERWVFQQHPKQKKGNLKMLHLSHKQASAHCAMFRAFCFAMHCQCLQRQRARVPAQRCGKSLEIVAERVLLSATVSAICLATFSAVARYVTLGNVSCDLSRNGVARQAAQMSQIVLTL